MMELIKGKHYFLKGQHLNIISGISYTKGHIVQTEHDDACRKRSYRYKGTVSKVIKGQYPKNFPGAGSAVVVLVQPLDKEGILGPSSLTLRKQIHPLKIL